MNSSLQEYGSSSPLQESPNANSSFARRANRSQLARDRSNPRSNSSVVAGAFTRTNQLETSENEE